MNGVSFLESAIESRLSTNRRFEAGTEIIDIQLDDRSDGVDFTTI